MFYKQIFNWNELNYRMNSDVLSLKIIALSCIQFRPFWQTNWGQKLEMYDLHIYDTCGLRHITFKFDKFNVD